MGEEHWQKGYKRFNRQDGIVCEEKWEGQSTPKVCYFLKEAYTSEENGYCLTESLHEAETSMDYVEKNCNLDPGDPSCISEPYM